MDPLARAALGKKIGRLTSVDTVAQKAAVSLLAQLNPDVPVPYVCAGTWGSVDLTWGGAHAFVRAIVTREGVQQLDIRERDMPGPRVRVWNPALATLEEMIYRYAGGRLGGPVDPPAPEG